MPKKYIHEFKRDKKNTDLLLAFPFSGAVAQSFRCFSQYLPGNINFYAIQYPGRGLYIAESLVTSLEEMIELLYESVLDSIKSYSTVKIYGHSVGGLVAYELLQSFVGNSVNIDHCDFNVGACPSPNLIGKRSPIHKLSDDDFWAVINNYDGTPKEILDDSDLRAIFLPILRADFTIYERYNHDPIYDHTLQIPIRAFGGNRDNVVCYSELDSWENHTSVNYEQVLVDGNHFFCDNSAKYIIEKIFQETFKAVS